MSFDKSVAVCTCLLELIKTAGLSLVGICCMNMPFLYTSQELLSPGNNITHLASAFVCLHDYVCSLPQLYERRLSVVYLYRYGKIRSKIRR